MIHPSNAAENYIFERFCEAYLDDSTKEINDEIMKILMRVNHRPMFPTSVSYKKHVEGTINLINQWQKKFVSTNELLDAQNNFHFKKELDLLEQLLADGKN